MLLHRNNFLKKEKQIKRKQSVMSKFGVFCLDDFHFKSFLHIYLLKAAIFS